MSSGLRVPYSPLCDTNLHAYLAFIVANRDGSSTERITEVDGGADVARCNGGSPYVGVRSGDAIYAYLASSRPDTCDYRWLATVYSGEHGLIDNSDKGGSQDSGLVAGLPGCSVGDSGCGVRGGAVDVSSDVDGKGVDAKHQDARVELNDRYVLPQRRGPRGGVSVGRGKNYEKNQAARLRRKVRQCGSSSVGVSEVVGSSGVRPAFAGKRECSSQGWRVGEGDKYGTFAACTQDQRDELQRTRAERLAAENKLKTAIALQELELVRARDIGQLKKRQETKLMRDTEVNKVQVERAFGTLAGTGNVPGFAQTVVSSGESGSGSAPGLASGSISPNSSVSMAEIHAMQKENLEMKRREEMLAQKNPELYAEIFAAKLSSEKTGWTMDQEGNILGVHDALGGYVGSDGRFHEGEDYSSW